MSQPPTDIATVYRYHDGTKHHFHRFAQSLGYLDWACQPHPFRSFAGAPRIPLYPSPAASSGGYISRSISWGDVFNPLTPPVPCSAAAIGDLLRHSLGLSAWKQFGNSRWSLRVNPSSGNLHPTEAYVACGARSGLPGAPGVFHYAADRHELEQRCAIGESAWSDACGRDDDIVIVALTSIHWREAWRYGERAFRYCQHDLGHAVAAIAVSGAMLGWKTTMLPTWSQPAIAAFIGTDRDEDFIEAEPEAPACILALTRGGVSDAVSDGASRFMAAAQAGRWTGRASQLSADHTDWSFIDEVTHATVDLGRQSSHLVITGGGAPPPPRTDADASVRISMSSPRHGRRRDLAGEETQARDIVLQRRSALALDGRYQFDSDVFFELLARLMPTDAPPWNAIWWTPRVHLGIFVHRIGGLASGLYLLARGGSAEAVQSAFGSLRAACDGDLLWEPAHDSLPLVCLVRGDYRRLAGRLSCDQEIAADGFFSLGMLADFDASLAEHGAPFYRNLFWEAGVLGQVLYLESEALGARGTGIGCFYDDPVHDALSLRGHAFQSLYHFAVGVPVEDARLLTRPGYDWEGK